MLPRYFTTLFAVVVLVSAVYAGEVAVWMSTEDMSRTLAPAASIPVVAKGAAPGLNGAVRIANLFRNGCRSYNSWVIMIDYDGNPNNGPFKTKRTAIQPRRDGTGVDYNFSYYGYGQFMKFIRRGAHRIGSTEGTRRVVNVAFQNPDGTIVLVVTNLDRSASPIQVVCNDQMFEAELPAKTLTTFAWHP